MYGLLGESQQSARFIERCRNEDLAGVTTTEVVGEVCHRLMLKEAMDLGLIGRPNAASLKAKHKAILLTNDSLVVAACVGPDIRALASRDADFESIAELMVYSPSDLS